MGEMAKRSWPWHAMERTRWKSKVDVDSNVSQRKPFKLIGFSGNGKIYRGIWLVQRDAEEKPMGASYP